MGDRSRIVPKNYPGALALRFGAGMPALDTHVVVRCIVPDDAPQFARPSAWLAAA